MAHRRALLLVLALCACALTVRGHITLGYPCTCSGTGATPTCKGITETAYCKPIQQANGQAVIDCKCIVEDGGTGGYMFSQGYNQCFAAGANGKCSGPRRHKTPHPCNCEERNINGQDGLTYTCHRREKPLCKTNSEGTYNEHDHCQCFKPSQVPNAKAGGWDTCPDGANGYPRWCVREQDRPSCVCLADSSETSPNGLAWGCEDSSKVPICKSAHPQQVDETEVCRCFPQSVAPWVQDSDGDWSPDNCSPWCLNNFRPTPCSCVNTAPPGAPPNYQYGCPRPNTQQPMCNDNHDVQGEGERCQCFPKAQQSFIEQVTGFRASTCNDWCIPPISGHHFHHPCSCEANGSPFAPFGCLPSETPICTPDGGKCECVGTPYIDWWNQHQPGGAWSAGTCNSVTICPPLR